jgi:hypothetical protein
MTFARPLAWFHAAAVKSTAAKRSIGQPGSGLRIG